MNDFLKKVVEGNGVSPSDICKKSFNENFADAINVEWFKKDSYYETVFYKNEQEYIAIFNLSGILIEYRQNLPINYLPVAIKNVVISNGEIMNSILKNKGNMLEYEIIVRDKELNRFMITFSETGRIIEKRKL